MGLGLGSGLGLGGSLPRGVGLGLGVPLGRGLNRAGVRGLPGVRGLRRLTGVRGWRLTGVRGLDRGLGLGLENLTGVRGLRSLHGVRGLSLGLGNLTGVRGWRLGGIQSRLAGVRGVGAVGAGRLSAVPRRRRQIPHPPTLLRHRREPRRPQQRRELGVPLACDDESDTEDDHQDGPQDSGHREGAGAPARPYPEGGAPDGQTDSRVPHPLLGALAGEVEVDTGLEEFQRVRDDGRQRHPVAGLRILRPVLRGTRLSLRAGVGHDEHRERVVAAAALPYVRVLVAELLGDEGESGQLLHRGHGARELHRLPPSHQPEHLPDLPFTHAVINSSCQPLQGQRAQMGRRNWPSPQSGGESRDNARDVPQPSYSA